MKEIKRFLIDYIDCEEDREVLLDLAINMLINDKINYYAIKDFFDKDNSLAIQFENYLHWYKDNHSKLETIEEVDLVTSNKIYNTLPSRFLGYVFNTDYGILTRNSEFRFYKSKTKVF